MTPLIDPYCMRVAHRAAKSRYREWTSKKRTTSSGGIVAV